jgi:hypothetical protein
MGYTKADVEVRHGGPAVNVKAHAWPYTGTLAERLGVSEDDAERAATFALEASQEDFWTRWRDRDELAFYFPDHTVTVEPAGRQDGWLVVEGLPPIDDWDAILLGRWRKFERDVTADVAYRCKLETVIDEIEANRWAEPGSERFNWIDVDGKPYTLAEAEMIHGLRYAFA